MEKKHPLSRRDFGKVTAAAAAGFAAWTARKSEAQETNSETLKVGILGCGGRGGADLVRFLAGNELSLIHI